jgi:transmembrane sensor
MSHEDNVDAVDSQAERWFTRLRASDCTATERREFDAWLIADAAHASAYARTQQLWSDLDGLADDADVAQWRHEARQSAGAKSGRARRWLAAAAAVVIVGLTGGGFAWWRSSGTSVANYATASGKQRSVSLADGSKVMLNTATVLNTRLARHTRSVQLRQGEAIFHVIHDEHRPFVVHAGSVTVTDLGTRFDVRRDRKRTVVTVIKGAVAVARGSRNAELTSGEQLTAGNSVWRERHVHATTVTAWTQGNLIFHATPLADVVAQVNRYASERLVIVDSSLKRIKVSGRFRIGNTDALVRALQSAFPIRAAHDPVENRIRLYRRNPPPVIPAKAGIQENQ